MDFHAIYRAEKARMQAALLSTADNDKNLVYTGDSLQILSYGIAYCNTFLSAIEARKLVANIDAIHLSEWATLSKRKILNLGGVPHPCGSWAESIPESITGSVRSKLASLAIFNEERPFDQILLNEYTKGAGISAHRDGPLFQPRVAIVSLGGDAILEFLTHIDGPAVAAIVLRANSLVVFQGEAYLHLFHRIQDLSPDNIGNYSEIVPNCALNSDIASALPGTLIQRPERRLSLTLRQLAKQECFFSAFDVLSPEVAGERNRRRQWWLQSISEKK